MKTPPESRVQARQETPPNFDRLAPFYRWMEAVTFGPWLWRCRTAFLPRLRDSCRALILGDGDGRFTAALLRVNPHLHVDAVDISPAMLRSLLGRASSSAGRVRAHVADARSWAPPLASAGSGLHYDLVITHFFLDCLTTAEVADLVARLRPAIAPGARWVVSEFAVPRNRYGRWIAAPLISFLYFGFRILTGLRIRKLPDYLTALREAGFVPQDRRVFLRGLLVAELLTLPNPSEPKLDTPSAASRH